MLESLKKDKQEKIEKLLRLSMSGNEHEAKAALDKAIEMMEKYNIQEKDIYKTNIIHKKLDMDNFTLKNEITDFATRLGSLSGIYVLYSQGSKQHNFKAKFHITGFEQDVINFEYLLFIFISILKKESNKKKLSLRKYYLSNIENKNHKELQAFRRGFIDGFLKKIEVQKKEFFRNEQKEFGLMIVPDFEKRYNESKNYYESNFDTKIKKINTTLENISSKHYSEGMKASEDFHLNQGVEQNTNDKKLLN